MRDRVLEGFAGPGGMSEALRILGLPGALGVEINAGACATARAAGHERLQADIRSLDPADFSGVQGWISGPPCPTYSDSGKRSGRSDYGTVLVGADVLGDPFIGHQYRGAYGAVTDERSALVLETLRFALELPGLRWMIAEQVPAVAQIWEEFAAELAIAYWETCMVLTLRADDFGLPTRRTRTLLVATRDWTPDFSDVPMRALWRTGRNDGIDVVIAPGGHRYEPSPPHLTMAEALRWPQNVRVNTRGERKTPGGNEFSADQPAPSLTGRARSWWRTDLGSVTGRLTAAEAGKLQGFRADYPWQGSRTSQFQQVADSVPPPMGAAVIGATLGLPWRDRVETYLADLYGEREAPAGQLDLLAEVS